MMAGSRPASKYPLKRAAISIQFSISYEQHAARQAAGLSLAEYHALPGTPLWKNDGDAWSKAEVIAWYRMSQLIPAIQQDAQMRESERRNRLRSMR